MKGPMTLLLFLFFTMSQSIFGQGTEFDLSKKDVSTFTEDDLKEVETSRKELLPKSRDEATGLFLKSHNTRHDSFRISFLAHINPDYESFFDINTYEFIFAKRFKIAWIEATLSKTSATFSEIIENNFNIQAETPELRESSQDILSFGLGLSYHSTWIRELVSSDSLFTSTSAFLTYQMLTEGLSGQEFSGLGIKTDFGVFRRTSSNMHIGGKISYNLSQVSKSQEFEGQTSSSRSYLLTWLTLALDISFYF